MSNTNIDPNTIEGWEWEAFANGEPNERIAQLILEQRFYARKVERIQQRNELARSALYRFDCPSNTELLTYHLGMIELKQRRKEIESHVEECRACLADLAALGAIDAKYEDKYEAQPSLVQRLVQVFAVPVLASARTKLRGDESASLLKILEGQSASFEVPGTPWEITIQTLSARLNFLMTGLLVSLDGSSIPSATVKLLQGEQELYSVPLGEDGDFKLEASSAGTYQLRIETDELQIDIPSVIEFGLRY